MTVVQRNISGAFQITPLQLRRLLKLYATELKANPDDIEVQSKTAEVLNLLGRKKEAISLYCNVAWKLGMAGNLGPAISVCKHILELDPKNGTAQKMLEKLFACKELRERKQVVPVARSGEQWVVDPSSAYGGLQAAGQSSTEHLPVELPPAEGAPCARTPRTLQPTEPLEDATPERARSSLRRPTLVGYLMGTDFELRETEPHPRATRRYPAVQQKVQEAKAAQLCSQGASQLKPEPAMVGGPAAGLAGGPLETTSAETPTLKQEAAASRAGARLDARTIESLLWLDALRQQAAAPTAPPPPSVSSYRAIQQAVRLDGAQLEQRSLAADDTAEDLEQPPEIPCSESWLQDLASAAKQPAALELSAPLASDRTASLARFSLFANLEREALVALVCTLETRSTAAGELVFYQEQPGDSLFLVVSGSLEVFKTAADKEQEILLARLGGGSFFGEFGLLTDRKRHASVRCLEACELLELKRPALEQLIQTHPSIAWTLRTFYQQRVMANVMATSPLFLAIDLHERAEVLSRFKLQRFFEDEIIIQQGAMGGGFYVLLAGLVEVSCLTEQAKQQMTLGTLAEGEYFGEMSLLTGNPAQATVKALDVAEVLVLNSEDFYELSAAHPEIWSLVQAEAERRYQQNALLLEARLPTSGEMCLI